MSGAITDLPIRVCPSCRIVFMEDEHMYEEPWRCPKCGLDLNEAAADDIIEEV